MKIFNESGKGYWMEGCGCLRAEGENRPSRPSHIVCFQQNQRDEVRNMGDCAGAIIAESGMHNTNFVAYPKPGTLCYVQNTDSHEHETIKIFMCEAMSHDIFSTKFCRDGKVDTLSRTDYKEPPIVTYQKSSVDGVQRNESSVLRHVQLSDHR